MHHCGTTPVHLLKMYRNKFKNVLSVEKKKKNPTTKKSVGFF